MASKRRDRVIDATAVAALLMAMPPGRDLPTLEDLASELSAPWRARAACRGLDPDLFFPEGKHAPRLRIASESAAAAAPPSCTVDDCERRAISRGLCNPHYRRASRAGTLPKTWTVQPLHRAPPVEFIDARDICATCPVTDECLEYATRTESVGWWAGTSADARSRLRRAL